MPYRPKIKNSDGTLTDLPLEAETAVKLKTSRSIGLSGVTATAQSFNGTSAITIPITAIPATLLTGTASINTTGNAATATKATTADSATKATNADNATTATNYNTSSGTIKDKFATHETLIKNNFIMVALTLSKGTGVSSITATVKGDSSRSKAISVSSSTTIYVPYNSTVNFSASASSGYTMSSYTTSTTMSASKTISFTATESSSGGGGGCVTANTLIAVSETEAVRAEDLQKDAKILCYDFNEDTVFEDTVLQTFTLSNVTQIYKVTAEDGTCVKVTGNHPFLCPDIIFKTPEAVNGFETLQVGDQVVTVNGAKVVTAIEVEELPEPQTVYNFLPENGLAFIADGFVVMCEASFMDQISTLALVGGGITKDLA